MDFSVSLHWSTGALPPQYAYRYEVHIAADGTGKLEFEPGYGEFPERSWHAEFVLSPAQMDSLFGRLQGLGVFRSDFRTSDEMWTGGPGSSFVVHVGVQEFRIPGLSDVHRDDYTRVEEAIEAVRMVVPEGIREEMMERQQAGFDPR